MSGREASSPTRAIAVPESRVLSDSGGAPRSVRSPTKHWQPPEGLSPEEVRAVIAAARSERDRLLLRVLWATGARISEVLALRPRDVHRDSLVLPNRKNPQPDHQARVSARVRAGADGRAAALGQGAGPGRRRAAVLLAQARRGRLAPAAPAWPGLAHCQGGLGAGRRPRPGAPHVQARAGRRGGPHPSAPASACSGAPDRAPDQELATGAAPGRLEPPADGLPHRRRRGSAGADA